MSLFNTRIVKISGKISIRLLAVILTHHTNTHNILHSALFPYIFPIRLFILYFRPLNDRWKYIIEIA